MWQRELLALGTGLAVLGNGAIVWMIYQIICNPKPTPRSEETIRHLMATVSRLRAENQELRTTVFSLSQQGRRPSPSQLPEPLP